MMTDQYEVSFVRLTFGEPQKVDGIIALGVFSEKEIDFLRSLSFAIVFVNSNQHNYDSTKCRWTSTGARSRWWPTYWIRSSIPDWDTSAASTTGPMAASVPTVWRPSGAF